MNYKQKAIEELSDNIKKQGYRAFIAESGTYGFYTDKEGTKVISFQCDLGSINFSGNYKTNMPKQTGSGWRLDGNDEGACKEMFNAYPPKWAVRDAKWEYTTLSQHLDTYDKSSRYSEV